MGGEDEFIPHYFVYSSISSTVLPLSCSFQCPGSLGGQAGLGGARGAQGSGLRAPGRAQVSNNLKGTLAPAATI